MYSLAFPNMLSKSGAKTDLLEDRSAVESNLRLLMSSTCGELFGDPDFGCSLKKRIYDQSSTILADLVIDDIYVSILTFMPQLKLDRKDINIKLKDTHLYAEIKCTNLIDYQTNTYMIQLISEDNI